MLRLTCIFSFDAHDNVQLQSCSGLIGHYGHVAVTLLLLTNCPTWGANDIAFVYIHYSFILLFSFSLSLYSSFRLRSNFVEAVCDSLFGTDYRGSVCYFVLTVCSWLRKPRGCKVQVLGMSVTLIRRAKGSFPCKVAGRSSPFYEESEMCWFYLVVAEWRKKKWKPSPSEPSFSRFSELSMAVEVSGQASVRGADDGPNVLVAFSPLFQELFWIIVFFSRKQLWESEKVLLHLHHLLEQWLSEVCGDWKRRDCHYSLSIPNHSKTFVFSLFFTQVSLPLLLSLCLASSPESALHKLTHAHKMLQWW